MTKVYLGLGTNLGNREKNLQSAVGMIQERIGKVISLSSFYETAPWGFVSDNTFLNAAACVETDLSPEEVLATTQQIEREMGRQKKSADGVYTDRPIDIDILLFGDLIFQSPQLTVPHPLMTERGFVMRPLAEIAPNVIHPVFRKPLKELVPAE